jgi:hypothetical protein
MPIGPAHHLEYSLDILLRDGLMEEVAHAVDKNALGTAPAERKE